MKNKPTDIGMNRTGVATSPIDAKHVVEATTPSSGDGKLLEHERVGWARDAEPVGSVPPPGTLKGVAKTLLEKLRGREPSVLVDKLGERLAYERTGTRLYEALIVKLEAAHLHEGGPTRGELEEIRDHEHHHMMLVAGALRRLGADPTAMTPSADVVGVAGLGWVQVLGDPRTTLAQCLDVMLIVEQGDVEGWSMLIELADELELADLAEEFRSADVIERTHALKVRRWLSSSLLGQLGVQPTPPRPHPRP